MVELSSDAQCAKSRDAAGSQVSGIAAAADRNGFALGIHIFPQWLPLFQTVSQNSPVFHRREYDELLAKEVAVDSTYRFLAIVWKAFSMRSIPVVVLKRTSTFTQACSGTALATVPPAITPS